MCQLTSQEAATQWKFSHVVFDAVTGELLLAEEKIEYEYNPFA